MEEKKQEKIIVVQNNQKTSDGPHLTGQRYIRGIYHFKYWIIGLTLVCGISGYLVTRFLINPSRETLTTNIESKLALSRDGNAYLDGTSFSYTDIVSKENITEVIEKNPDFSHYNIDRLCNSNAFSITAVTTTNQENNTAETNRYTITTTLSDFPSSNDAKLFLRAMLDNITEKAEKGIEAFQFKNSLPTSQEKLSSLEFDEIINELESQYNYINSSFKDMSTFFGNYTKVDGMTLDQHYSDFKTNYSSTSFSALKGELYSHKYINLSSMDEVQNKIDEYNYIRSSYEVRFQSIHTEISSAKELLSILTNIKSPTEEIGQKISQLTEEISALESEKKEMILTLKNIGFTINETEEGIVITEDTSNESTYLYKLKHADEKYIQDCSNFKTKLTGLYHSLNDTTDSASDLYRKAYQQSKKNRIDILDSGNGIINNHISNALVCCACAVLAFIVFSFLFVEIDINKEYQKQKNETEKK